MKSNFFRLSMVSALVSTAFTVVADDRAGAIPTASGIDIVPELTWELKHDNNVANTRTDKVSSFVSELTPSVAMVLTDGVNEYSLASAFRFGDYFQSRQDNFFDAGFRADAKMEFTDRHRIRLQGNTIFGHEQRGQGVSDSLGFEVDEPGRFEEYEIKGHYEFGARSTPARLRLSAGYLDKGYTNLREFSQFRDFDRRTVGATFFFSTLASTDLVAEVMRNDINYKVVDIDRGSRDNKDISYRVGLDWEITALTSGELRIGQQRKTFDNPLREDFKGLSWNLSVTYEPLSYSRFTLETGRRATDPMTAADYVKDSTYGGNWQHDWNSDLKTNVRVRYVNSDFVGVTQRNKFWNYGADVNYRLSYWLTVFAGFDIADRDSTVERFIYDKRVISLGLRVGI